MPEEWEIIDSTALAKLLSSKGAAPLLDDLDKGPRAGERAAELRQLAVHGDISRLREQVRDFREWAEAHALRRVLNILIELQRAMDLKARGQMIFHAQSLTRLLLSVIDEDVSTLRRELEAA